MLEKGPNQFELISSTKNATSVILDIIKPANQKGIVDGWSNNFLGFLKSSG